MSYFNLLNDINIFNVKNIIDNKTQPFYDYFTRFDVIDNLLNTTNEKCFIVLLDDIIKKFSSFRFVNINKTLKYFCMNASKNGLFEITKHILNTYNDGLLIDCIDSAIHEKWKLSRFSFIMNDSIKLKIKKLNNFIAHLCRIISKSKMSQYRITLVKNMLKSKTIYYSITYSTKIKYVDFIINHYYL